MEIAWGNLWTEREVEAPDGEWTVKHGNSLGELRWRKRDRSAGRRWTGRRSVEIAFEESSAGGSDIEAPDEGGLDGETWK